MLALNSSVPSSINLFLMKGQPPDDYLHLLSRQGAGEQLTIHADRGGMFSIIHVNMGLVVVFRVVE